MSQKLLMPCIYLYQQKAVTGLNDKTVVNMNPVELARYYSVCDFRQCTSFKYVCLYTGGFKIRSGTGYLYVCVCIAAVLWRFKRKGFERKADRKPDYYFRCAGVYIAVKKFGLYHGKECAIIIECS